MDVPRVCWCRQTSHISTDSVVPNCGKIGTFHNPSLWNICTTIPQCRRGYVLKRRDKCCAAKRTEPIRIRDIAELSLTIYCTKITEEYAVNEYGTNEVARMQAEIDCLRAEIEQLRIDKITLGNFGVLPNYRSEGEKMSGSDYSRWELHKELADYRDEIGRLRAENADLRAKIASDHPANDPEQQTPG